MLILKVFLKDKDRVTIKYLSIKDKENLAYQLNLIQKNNYKNYFRYQAIADK